MEQEKNRKKRLVDKVKTIVSEATDSVETAADKAMQSTKSIITDAVSSKRSINIRQKASESTEAIAVGLSDKIKSTKTIVSEFVPPDPIKTIEKKASQTAKVVIDGISDGYESAKKIVTEKTTIENIKKVGNAATDLASVETVKMVGKAVSDVATLENTMGAAKYASGVKGYKEIKQAKEIKRNAEERIQQAIDVTENMKKELNSRIETYAEIKLAAINNTICVFVDYLRQIGQKNKGKEYEALKSIDIQKEDIADMKDLGISTANLAKGTAGSALIGAVALFGTKAAVLQGVVSLATASTGTAISGLSGAAATNATLAFLGGGSVASGGGGMAAGALVLGGITAGAFITVGALTGGILLSAHGSRALTMATQYAAEVDKGIATLEKSWVVMDGISERVNELEYLVTRLEKMALKNLKNLKGFIHDFDTKNLQHKKAFQQTALLMKSMSELANTPIIDEKGSVTEDSRIVAGKIKTILNT